MKIYIDGKLRKEYTTKNTRITGRLSAVAYVVMRINPEDSGKTVTVESSTDSSYSGYYYPVYIGNELGICYELLKKSSIEIISALLIFILGFICTIGGILLKFVWKKNTEIHFLSIGILMAAVWIITNSPLRQLIFDNISVANDIPFFAVMIIPMPFVLYMNRRKDMKKYIWEYVDF